MKILSFIDHWWSYCLIIPSLISTSLCIFFSLMLWKHTGSSYMREQLGIFQMSFCLSISLPPSVWFVFVCECVCVLTNLTHTHRAESNYVNSFVIAMFSVELLSWLNRFKKSWWNCRWSWLRWTRFVLQEYEWVSMAIKTHKNLCPCFPTFSFFTCLLTLAHSIICPHSHTCLHIKKNTYIHLQRARLKYSYSYHGSEPLNTSSNHSDRFMIFEVQKKLFISSLSPLPLSLLPAVCNEMVCQLCWWWWW